MAEEKYDLEGESGIKIEKGRFATWLENFWYHYKWHSIVTLFIILVVTICTVQMCKKEEYDVHFIYAGSEQIRGVKTEGDLSLYQTISKSLNEAAEDFDENGEITSSFEPLYMLTADEIAAIEKEIADKKANGEGSYTLNYAQLTENEAAFSERMAYSDTYVFLISESIYRSYQSTEHDIPVFSSLKELANTGTDVEFLDDYAVYLHSTKFGKLPGLSELPEDTVIALRSVNALSSHFDREKTVELYENAKVVVKNMLNYGN